MRTDHFAWLGLSASCGQAGPGSTRWYIHCLDNPLVRASRKARPVAWSGGPEPRALNAVFAHLCDGQVVDVPCLPARRPREVPPQCANELTIEQRRQIVWDVQCGYRLEAVAAKAMVPQSVVAQATSEMAATLSLVGMARQAQKEELRSHCQAVTAWVVWARAALQPKHDRIRHRIAALEQAGDWASLRRLWADYLLCRHRDDISVLNVRPAVRLIQFLKEAGVPMDSLATSSTTTAPPLALEVQALSIARRDPATPRRGRADHRLFLTQTGVSAKTATAATVSMRGLHWIFLGVGSALVGRGDI